MADPGAYINENKANRFNYAKSQGIYENKYVQLRQKHGDFKEKSVEVRGYFIVISFFGNYRHPLARRASAVSRDRAFCGFSDSP